MRLVALVAVLAPAFAHADGETETTRAAATLEAAIRTRDVRAVTAHLGSSFTNGGVWFADPACAREFSEPSDVTGKRVAVFARCLAKHRLQLSTRTSSRAEGAVLTVDPGIEIEVAFRGSQVRWIGHPLHLATGAIIPTLTAQAFEALRTRGTTNLDGVLTGPPTSAWIKFCLDATGARTAVTYHGAESSTAGEQLLRAIDDWSFRPLTVRGIPIAACSLSLLTYPVAKTPVHEVLPVTSMPALKLKSQDFAELDAVESVAPQAVAPHALERLRLTGTRQVEPDTATRNEMIDAGRLSVLASIKLCVNARGRVASVAVNKPSGFPAYDQKILGEAGAWTYRPYLIAKNPVDVCSTVSFIIVPDPTMLHP